MALPDGAHRPVHVNSFIDPQKGEGGVGAAAPVRWLKCNSCVCPCRAPLRCNGRASAGMLWAQQR